MNIHIFWSGPYELSRVKELRDESKDYGIYQIYGHHTPYGSNILLYIGKANQQTFGKRIAQEGWEFEYDPGHVEIYIGRLAGKEKPALAKWEKQIDAAEKLRIHAHYHI